MLTDAEDLNYLLPHPDCEDQGVQTGSPCFHSYPYRNFCDISFQIQDWTYPLGAENFDI